MTDKTRELFEAWMNREQRVICRSEPVGGVYAHDTADLFTAFAYQQAIIDRMEGEKEALRPVFTILTELVGQMAASQDIRVEKVYQCVKVIASLLPKRTTTKEQGNG